MPGHSTLKSKPGLVSADNKRKGSRQNEQRIVKQIRILYTDPDLTDSSSDDEGVQKYKHYNCHGVKRCVKEVCVFGSVSDIKKSSKVKSQNSPNGMSLKSKYAGVRKRPSGKWSAEITDHYNRVKLWLGTHNTEEEAHSAYERKKLEIQSLMQQKKLNSKDVLSFRLVAQSPSSVLEDSKMTSNGSYRSSDTNTNTDVNQDCSKNDVEEEKSCVADEVKPGDIKDEIQGLKMVNEDLKEEDFLNCNLGDLADDPNFIKLLDLDKEDFSWLDEILKSCGLDD